MNVSAVAEFLKVLLRNTAIDNALQNEFIRLRFCQLPSNDILKFLQCIVAAENLNISDEHLKNIRSIFKSDIRSMINFLQSNHHQTIMPGFLLSCLMINLHEQH